MAKYRSHSLRWKLVESDEVVGYKIYWSRGDKVTYDSPSIYIQDLDEIVIPDALEGFVPEPGIYMFGITAIDKWANESDLTLLKEPLTISAPAAPAALWVQPLAVPPPPESVWVEAIDVAVGLEKKKEETITKADLCGKDNYGSQQLHTGQKKPSNQPPDFYDHLGMRKP